MNKPERLVRALKKDTVDRPPVVGPMVAISHQLMDRVGIHLPSAHHDLILMGKLSAAAFEICGLESLKVPLDLMVEIEALSAEIDFGDDDTLPRPYHQTLSNAQDLNIPPDFLRLKRVPLVLDTIRWCRKHYGNIIPVISSIVGPYTLAGYIFGLEKLMLWMLTDVQAYAGVMDKLTALATRYAQAQFAAGAHIVQAADPMASGDLISPKHYAEFIAPYHLRLFSALTGPTILHICGRITGHLPHIIGTGINGLSFDEKTDIAAVPNLKEKLSLVGFVPTSVLRTGLPDDVKLHSKLCLQAGVDVLSAGCSLHLETPIANIKAMVEAVKNP